MTLWELAGLLCAFNLMTFGNGPVMIPLLKSTLVERRHVLTTEQLLYAFTIARITPGQANVYVAAIGYMLFGLGGAIVSTLVVMLPGYLMLPLARGYARVRAVGAVSGFMRGLIAASVGLILAATVEMARSSLTGEIAWTVFGLAVVTSAVLKWNSFLVLAVPSAVGVALTLIR
jgi:chromate transporter